MIYNDQAYITGCDAQHKLTFAGPRKPMVQPKSAMRPLFWKPLQMKDIGSHVVEIR